MPTTTLSIRDDAVQRSRSVIVGKVTEHVVPYLPDFTYNPKDARFIGSPVDFVVFDGLDAGALQQIVLVEVKTGLGSLTKREKQIRDAIQNGNVCWREIRVAAPAPQLPEKAAHPVSSETRRLRQTESVRESCEYCGFVIQVTLRSGEDTAWCAQLRAGRHIRHRLERFRLVAAVAEPDQMLLGKCGASRQGTDTGTPDWLLPAAGNMLEVLLEEIGVTDDGHPLFGVARIEKPDDLQ